MDKAQRAELLRQRFKAKGGVPFVPSGKPRKMRHNISGRPIRMAWPEANADTRRAGIWMHQPDAKPKIAPRIKHSQGASAVVRIAAKAPKKLARAFATAEAYLASRERR